ncbi:hypothetical protein [Salinibacter altiplanensis]|uniref:hypothetical protein n=1 Tax=Salinibacter altiplanensis TaxID=1803181 RepID=UPI000C9F4892|nr:hypothetical protein [Salinibacter altiplanensis]
MALPVTLRKVDETPRYCLYDLGGEDAAAGRVKLYKASADVEVVRLSGEEVPARPPFYLAQGVSRLRTYCERDQYPDTDTWTA